MNLYHLRLLALLFWGCWIGASIGFAQDLKNDNSPSNVNEKVTLSGYVKDAKSGESLTGVNIVIRALETGAVSNNYGFFSLTVPKGKHVVSFSYIGYQAQLLTLELNQNTQRNVELTEEGVELESIEITDEMGDRNVKSTEMSVNRLDMRTIQKMPALLGEIDIIRSIQLLPGVSTVGEGATGFNVRGGTIDQNLILMDEAPVYNSSHLFGFFSIFNPDAVKDAQLYKGAMPAQYGGRLSSILDVRLKEGNAKKFTAAGGIGTIFSRLTLEAPIVKDKVSFIVAGRRSYIDILSKPFLPESLASTQFNFFDLSAKVNWKINPRNTVFLSGYFGRDIFGAGFKFNWGNGTGTLRWNRIWNDKLFSNTTAIYSNYQYVLGFGQTNNDRFDWTSRIITYSLSHQFNYYLNPKNTIIFGFIGTLYDFEPGNAVGISMGERRDVGLPSKWAMEGGVYADNEQKLNRRWAIRYGLRWSVFNYTGAGEAYDLSDPITGLGSITSDNALPRRPINFRQYNQWESIKLYNNFEPRLSVKYEVDEFSSIKSSYNRTAQYIHLVSNTTAATPLDVWTPSTNNILPQIGDQVAIGYFRNFGKDNMFESSVEVYYRWMQNQLDYVDGANLLLNPYLEADLLSAQGRAYGAEFYIKKSKGDLTGWISYTLARTERQVAGINRGEWFPNRFDRPHNLYVVAMYTLNKRVELSANFVYASGTPATFPTNRMMVQGLVIPHNSENRRNNYRIPDYHRFDFSLTLFGKKKPNRRWEGHWVFSVYNVYGRKNPFSVYFQPQIEDPQVTQATRFFLIGIPVPGVTYNFKF
jgi:hypothetical protein